MKDALANSLMLMLVVSATSCRHVPVDTGASSFTVVESQRAAEASTQVAVGDVGEPSAAKYTDDFKQAVSMKKTVVLPVYPAKALQAKAGRAVVGVQVTVDAAGQVTDIESSLLTYNTPGPFAADFLEAVKVAVRQWRFYPAEIIQMETAKSKSGDFTYQRIARSTKTETKLDLAFTFTATGQVETGK